MTAVERSVDDDVLVTVGQQFASPEGGLFASLAEIIAVTYESRRLATFLDKHGQVLTAAAPELTAFLSEHAANLGFGVAWAPVLGELWEAKRGPATAAIDVAARWGLALVDQDVVPAAWSVRLSRATPLMFGGRLVGTGDHMSVESDGHRLKLRISESSSDPAMFGVTVERVRLDGRWVDPRDSNVATRPAGPIDLVLASELPRPFLEGIDSEAAAVLNEDMYVSLLQGVDFLRVAAAEYHGWATQVLRQILVLKAESGRTKSGSRSDFPGLVHMSLPEEGLLVAENLVHEASHQYYHLARRLGPVVTGEDTDLYYSPAVGRTRPLDRLLLAFHAFGNVSLFYNRLRLADTAFEHQCDTKLQALRIELEQLREPMIGNPTLTPLGRSLVATLGAELVDRGLVSEAVL